MAEKSIEETLEALRTWLKDIEAKIVEATSDETRGDLRVRKTAIEAKIRRLTTSPPPPPKLNSVKQVLRKHRALLVHFDAVPGMGDRHLFFPENLRRAIYNHLSYELSCSVVLPGAEFILGPADNVPGAIGIIIRPNADDSVFSVFGYDHGNNRDYSTGKLERQMEVPTIEQCDASIPPKNGYNEWGVRNYTVLGILIVGPAHVVTQPVYSVAGAAPDKSHRGIGIDEVFSEFRGMRLFTMKDDGVYEICRSGVCGLVPEDFFYGDIL
jgi:hypothetical protein